MKRLRKVHLWWAVVGGETVDKFIWILVALRHKFEATAYFNPSFFAAVFRLVFIVAGMHSSQIVDSLGMLNELLKRIQRVLELEKFFLRHGASRNVS